MGDLNLIELVGSAVSSIGALKKLTLWQKLTLAFYTLGSVASTYAVSHDWKYAAIAGLSFFVAHAHGQLQPSPKQAPPAPTMKEAQQVAKTEAAKVTTGQDSSLLSSEKF